MIAAGVTRPFARLGRWNTGLRPNLSWQGLSPKPFPRRGSTGSGGSRWDGGQEWNLAPFIRERCAAEPRRPARYSDRRKVHDPHGADLPWPEATPQVLRQNPGSPGDAEPHRGSEILLRPVPRTPATSPSPRDGEGIKGVFQSVFPIKDFNETAVLEFVKYELEKPKYDVEECQQRDMTYSAPLKVTLRLIVFDVDEDTGAKSVKDIKEQDVFMGDMPLMTPNGTFIVNGTERVIVSQMHRSPGRVLRPRQGQDALLGQAALRLPDHSLPRLVAGLRVRRQGHRLRAHRPPPEAAGDDAALCARAGPGRHHATPTTTPSTSSWRRTRAG